MTHNEVEIAVNEVKIYYRGKIDIAVVKVKIAVTLLGHRSQNFSFPTLKNIVCQVRVSL